MIAVVLALAISALTGWCLLHLAAGWEGISRWLRGILGCGVGLLVSSMLFFLCLVAGVAQPGVVIALDVVVLFAVGGAYWRTARVAEEQREYAPATKVDRVLAAGVGIATLAHVFASLTRYRAEPLGFWDAFAIWNLKARFFHLAGGEAWQRAFDPTITWSHTDYPLLLPGSVARLWAYAGEPTTAAPALLSLLFFLLVLGLVYGAAHQLAGRRAAALCALALLASPSYGGQSVWQVADIPLSFWLLGALCLMAIAEREQGASRALYRWAGLLAGAAALTKNEGLLFAAAIFAVIAVAPRLWPQWSGSASVMAFAQGAAAPLLLLAVMKLVSLVFGGESDLASDFGLASLGRVVELDRHLMILASFGRTLLMLAGFPLLVVLAVAAVLARRGERPAPQPGMKMLLAVLAIQLAGYYGVYLVTERDLAWHLGTSNLRLFVQLWPSFLLLYFVARFRDPATTATA